MSVSEMTKGQPPYRVWVKVVKTLDDLLAKGAITPEYHDYQMEQIKLKREGKPVPKVDIRKIERELAFLVTSGQISKDEFFTACENIDYYVKGKE